jgi:hypothetical protein
MENELKEKGLLEPVEGFVPGLDQQGFAEHVAGLRKAQIAKPTGAVIAKEAFWEDGIEPSWFCFTD